MTDTRQAGTARDEVIAHLDHKLYVADVITQRRTHIGRAVDAIPTDLLQRLHDERLMNNTRPAPRSIP